MLGKWIRETTLVCFIWLVPQLLPLPCKTLVSTQKRTAQRFVEIVQPARNQVHSVCLLSWLCPSSMKRNFFFSGPRKLKNETNLLLLLADDWPPVPVARTIINICRHSYGVTPHILRCVAPGCARARHHLI